MNPEKSDIEQAANTIRAGTFDPVAIERLKRLVDHHKASRLLQQLICEEGAGCESKEETVSKTMLLLEGVGNMAPAIACILMAHLWPEAAVLSMHEVCDRIDLWIWDCKAPELVSELKLLASSKPDLIARRRFEQWIQAKEQAKLGSRPNN